nr:hypothetical protein SHINE37_70273 [Rhizobiaceae bacterium]
MTKRPEFGERKRTVAVCIGALKPIGNELSEFRSLNSAVAVRIHPASLRFQTFRRCHLEPTALAHALKGGLRLSIVENAISICVQPVEQGRTRRLYLGKLKRSIIVLVHLAESLPGSLPVRRASAASREDNHHAGQQFQLHYSLPFLGWDWHQRELLRMGTAAPTRRRAFFFATGVRRRPPPRRQESLIERVGDEPAVRIGSRSCPSADETKEPKEDTR